MTQRIKMRIERSRSSGEALIRRRRELRILDNKHSEASVKAIIEEVRRRGDAALVDFTRKFDGVDLSGKGVKVEEEDVKKAYKKVGEDEVQALKFLKDRILRAERICLKSYIFSQEEEGLTIHHVLRPIQSVGCYVPGGMAAYPSTLLMMAVPAKVAGVPRVVVCSPPTFNGEVNPLILVAADICDVDEVYRVGGAQAIASLAYGSESVMPVMKIVGPGRRIVNQAKALVSRVVAVDFPAGPSELLILADEAADPRFIALDLISQSEHAPDNVVGLVTVDEDLGIRVVSEVEKLLEDIDRGEIAAQSILENGFALICGDLNEAVEFVNAFAPEHLEILTRNPLKVAERILSAGLILIGPYTPASGSDYCFGTNHVLPTGGFSHMYSGLSVLDFVKRIKIVECTKKRLAAFEKTAKILALSEGLPNHFSALKERLKP